MADNSEKHVSFKHRLREVWNLGRFAFQTLIAPWPPFVVFLVAIGLIGGLTPFAQIKATTGLIDALTARVGVISISGKESLVDLLKPYLPWLLLLIGTMLVNRTIYMSTFQRYLSIQLSERAKERFDQLFFQKALSLRLEWFESTAYYDALQRARRAMDDNVVIDRLDDVQRLVANILGCIGIMWAFVNVHWGISLVMLLGTFVQFRWRIRREREIIKINYIQTPTERRRDYWRSLATERGPSGEVRLFSLGEHIIKAWRGLTDQMLKEVSDVHRRNMRLGVPVTTANIGLYGFVLLALIFAASRGAVSTGVLVALLYALQLYMVQIDMIGWRLERFQRFLSEFRYVPGFLSLEREEPKKGIAVPSIVRDGIRFQGVGFTYPGGQRPVLSGIDLHIRPGERIALVGQNGAGKSTLVKLLLGLYQPTEGHITVDGISLQDVDLQAWRRKVGAVFQDYMRYSLTARENIGLGCLDKLNDLESIKEAARLSLAAEAIERLPNGYDTILGKEFEDGQDLSQGEWQKLSIARAYLCGAEIMVLDEPTSALDALAELEVYRQFINLSEGKTVLLISHRLGSARLADRIVFLQNGRIVQEGTHSGLMASGGPYAELYEMQAGWYRERGDDAVETSEQNIETDAR